MASFDVYFEDDGSFSTTFAEEDAFHSDFGVVTTRVVNDYNGLVNKPSITEPDFHTVVIEGDKTFDEYGMRAMDALDIIRVLH